MHSSRQRGLRMMLALLVSALPIAGADATTLKARALSTAIAQSANPLQRAVWACEAGGQANRSAHARFFLGAVDHGAGLGEQPPLTLSGTRLTGLGQISNDKGWFNIRFACNLAPALDQARSFTTTVLSPMKAKNAAPRSAIPAAVGNSWYIATGVRLALEHGVKETDDRDFRANCAAKSGVIEIGLAHTAPWLALGGYATVAIMSGGKSLLYVARGVMDESLGAVIPVLTLAPGDPLFAQMASANDVSINIGADIAYAVLLQGATVPVRNFVAGCARA